MWAGARDNAPRLTHGVASGFPRTDGAVIWARSDRPAALIVETAATESFSDTRRFTGPLLTPDADGTGRIRLTGLPADSEVHYRVTLDADGALSEPATGVFRTAPATARDVRLIWSGDVAGQGFGINPDIGGMTVFRTMAERNPHFFIHSGDTVYADVPIPETLPLPDGRIWRNEISEAKSAVAQTLDQYRGQHAYNLTDANYRYFNAHVPQLVQWDDHEVINNWYPGEVLDNDKYTEKRVDILARHGHRAFHEWQPLEAREAVDGRVYQRVSYGPLLDVFLLDMRSYKDPNSPTVSNTAPSWVPARPDGSSTRWPHPRPCGRSWPMTCPWHWWSRTEQRTSRPSPTATTAYLSDGKPNWHIFSRSSRHERCATWYG